METDEASRRVAAMMVRHYDALVRTARSVSLCSEDAQDAVQRAFEIYLHRIDQIDPDRELQYMKVVVRNEAHAVRGSRVLIAPGEFNLEARESDTRTPEDHASGAELVGRSAEALAELRADEAKALLALAAGLSYQEICERFSWTYTRTNRNITRGRARFLKAFKGIESGARCEAFAPSIAALAGGRATSEELVQLRPHLRRCSACRATVRELHGARRGPRVAAALLLPAKWFAAARAEAYTIAVRASETASSLPWGGGRTAAATALVGICLGGAGGWCAVSADRHDPPQVVSSRARETVSSPARAERRRERMRPNAPVAVPRIQSQERTSSVSARTMNPLGATDPHPDPVPKSEEFGVQSAGRSVATAARFGAARPAESPQIIRAANLEFSVAG